MQVLNNLYNSVSFSKTVFTIIGVLGAASLAANHLVVNSFHNDCSQKVNKIFQMNDDPSLVLQHLKDGTFKNAFRSCRIQELAESINHSLWGLTALFIAGLAIHKISRCIFPSKEKTKEYGRSV